MKLEQLHADADLLRGHSLPLAAAPHRSAAHADPPPAPADDWMHDVRAGPLDAGTGFGASPDRYGDRWDPTDPADAPSSADARLPPLFSADNVSWPVPPPGGTAGARTAWFAPLVRFATRAHAPADAGRSSAADAAMDSMHSMDTPARRQVNLAPWLAAGVIGIVLLALAAGLISHQRIDVEAAHLVEAKRQVAEQALSLLHAADRSAAAGALQRPTDARPPAGAPSASESAPPSASELPATGRARHDAMLAAIKSGTVLASLPPSALAQPSPLPADLPPAHAATAAGPTRNSAAPGVTRPAKKVALQIEGTAPATARSAPPHDPLATVAVRGTLKGAAMPHHRVYQLRESDGEWLGFVARADADPLAAGVWAGSGDLLAGGWRVAEVTSQRLTLVGAGGALEILQP